MPFKAIILKLYIYIYDFSKQLQTIQKLTLQKPQHLFILKPTPLAPLEATNSFWALSIKASHLHTNRLFKKN